VKDFSLFPKGEEWATGDEALDLKLTNALKDSWKFLSLESIYNFYKLGMNLKSRVYNPALPLTIEMVTKALLFYFAPEEFNDHLFKKIKGRYFLKNKIIYNLSMISEIKLELSRNQKYRYKDQIDLYLNNQKSSERNPFVKYELKKSSYDFSAKIIFKEFRLYLQGLGKIENYEDEFFLKLKTENCIIEIPKLCTIWFDGDQLFVLDNISD